VPENSEEGCACIGKKRKQSKFENDEHVGHDMVSEKHRKTPYITGDKNHLVGFLWLRLLST
jgi:hypothetical protein